MRKDIQGRDLPLSLLEVFKFGMNGYKVRLEGAYRKLFMVVYGI